jgi:hypothetical protein
MYGGGDTVQLKTVDNLSKIWSLSNRSKMISWIQCIGNGKGFCSKSFSPSQSSFPYSTHSTAASKGALDCPRWRLAYRRTLETISAKVRTYVGAVSCSSRSEHSTEGYFSCEPQKRYIALTNSLQSNTTHIEECNLMRQFLNEALRRIRATLCRSVCITSIVYCSSSSTYVPS